MYFKQGFLFSPTICDISEKFSHYILVTEEYYKYFLACVQLEYHDYSYKRGKNLPSAHPHKVVIMPTHN